MAAQKQTQPELVAIYRLEFYKKQKNWKLSTDAKREKEKQKSKINTNSNSKILNETYCIETNAGDEDNALNDAFLKDESDKEALTPQPILHTQALEPIQACQECLQVGKPQNPWADYVADDESPSMEWGNLDKCSGDNEFEGYNGPVEGMVWTNSSQQQGWTRDPPAQLLPPECGEGLVWADSRGEQFTPWPDDQIWIPEIWAEDRLLVDSLEDIEQFLLGAHSAPHSSEIELCAPDVSEGELESNLSPWSVSRLPGAALAAAARGHAAALQLLLREGQRRRFKSTLSLDICAANHFDVTPRDVFSTEYSYEAFPTRDTGFTPQGVSYTPDKQYRGGIQQLDELNPLNALLNRVGSTHLNTQLLQGVGSTPVNLNMLRDDFVGGSFKNMPLFVGRGRGRLPENNDF